MNGYADHVGIQANPQLTCWFLAAISKANPAAKAVLPTSRPCSDGALAPTLRISSATACRRDMPRVDRPIDFQYAHDWMFPADQVCVSVDKYLKKLRHAQQNWRDSKPKCKALAAGETGTLGGAPLWPRSDNGRNRGYTSNPTLWRPGPTAAIRGWPTFLSALASPLGTR